MSGQGPKVLHGTGATKASPSGACTHPGLQYQSGVFLVRNSDVAAAIREVVQPLARRGSEFSLTASAAKKPGTSDIMIQLFDRPSLVAYASGMKLSERESQVLVSTRLQLDAPLPSVAKFLGVKQSSVRVAMKRLRDLRYISPLMLINVSKLGFTEYDITCGLALRGAAERQRFFSYLSQSRQISQVIETGGAYHCSFTVCAKTPAEVDWYLSHLGEKFGPVFVNESIGVCLRYTIFPPKYLSRKKYLKEMVVVTTEAADPSIDALDRNLLTTISRHPEFSEREVARSLKTSISTVSYRLRALEKKGVIVGCISLVRPHLFGHQMFRVYISVRALNPTLKQQIADFARTHPNVTYLIEWLGDWQFGFGVMVEHSTQASELVTQVYDLFGSSLNEVTLFPVGEDVKMEFFPFD